MTTRHKIVGLVYVLTLVASTIGCSSLVGQGRLYNLATAERVDFSLAFSGDRNGVAHATLPGGEELKGEFVLWVTRKGAVPDEVWGQIKGRVATLPGGSTEWSKVYGFGEGSEADPVGSATLVGPRGSLLEIVFYHAQIDYHVIGDGLARDHRGQWYRVMMGPLPKE
jgi:hypothetical protein